jgi:hypothetical protein
MKSEVEAVASIVFDLTRDAGMDEYIGAWMASRFSDEERTSVRER